MKILMINTVCGIRSTGRICTDIATALTKQGHEVKIAYGREHVPTQYRDYAVKIGSRVDVNRHVLQARIFDNAGFGSKVATRKFITWVKEYNPDIIHLHNLHGYYIHVEELFSYLKTCGKKILWTLHDCWAFTGHGAYFDTLECEKIGQCHHSSQKNDYPKSLIDFSSRNFERKKNLFTGVPNLTLITPSEWLANLVRNSFLKEYPVTVIHNGIDTTIFKPRLFEAQDLRKKFSLEGKQVLLGVASIWDQRKGLDDLLELSAQLKSYQQLVLIGLSKEQLNKLPKEIIGLATTDSVEELSAWYTLADVFINPTTQDNYPTTNLEAIACGTPVVSYPTGGSIESTHMYGIVCSDRTVTSILESLKEVSQCKRNPNFNLSKEYFVENILNLY